MFENIIKVFKTKIFVLFLSLVSMVLLARVLGAEGRGTLAAILIYPQIFLAIFEGGMRQSAINYIGQNKANDSEVVGVLLAYLIVAGSIGFLVVFFLIYTSSELNLDFPTALYAALILPCTLIVNALQGFLLGKEDINKFNILTWLQKFLYVILLFVLYLLGSLTVLSALIVTFMAALYNVFQVLYYFKRDYSGSVALNKSVAVGMIRMGVLYAIAFFLIQANYKLDILLLTWLSSADAIGNYVVTVQVGELLWQLPSAVLIVLISKSANSENKNIISSICKTSRLTFLLSLIFSILLLFATYSLSNFVFGTEYKGLFEILLYLTPGLVFACLFKTLNAYYAGKGRPKVALLVMSICVFLNIVFNYLLIPSYGAVGAAIASSISYSLSGLLMAYIFSNEEGINFNSLILPSKEDIIQMKVALVRKLGK